MRDWLISVINSETVGLGDRFLETADQIITECVAEILSMSYAEVNYHFI